MAFSWKQASACLGVALALALLSGPAAAQKVGREWLTSFQYGFELKYPDKWDLIPPQEEFEQGGVIFTAEGRGLSTRVGNSTTTVKPYLLILRLEEDNDVVTRGEDEGTGGLSGRIRRESKRPAIQDLLEKKVRGILPGQSELRDFREKREDDRKIKKIEAKREEFSAFTGNYDISYTTWTIPMDDYDVCLVFSVPTQHYKKWGKAFDACAKTFRFVEREGLPELKDGIYSSYEDKLAYHQAKAASTPGWQVVEVPSNRYLIVTSSEDRKFLKQLIPRIENSRNVFETDFPPSRVIDHVSIVRVCKDQDEFISFAKVGGNVGGYFSPTTTELVLYDSKNYDRNWTWVVVSHEAFHQYCHFLFDESEAHRWFDEGTGDYYGMFEFRGKKAIPQKSLGGISRLSDLKTQLRQAEKDPSSWTPLAKLIRMNHQQWQSKFHYPQSWGIIYMLRQGMLGKVSKKYWEEEWENIIPNYVHTLHTGFLEAYKEVEEERREKAASQGKELSEDDLKINRFDLTKDQKDKIWKQAIAASWGTVDILDFEARWKLYIAKGIR